MPFALLCYHLYDGSHSLFPFNDLFPQGFLFDFEISVTERGKLSLGARFTLDVVGVNPVQTLSGISSTLSSSLSDLDIVFEGLTGAFGSSFNQASQLLSDIAKSDKIQLALNATIDFKVDIDLSLTSFELTSRLSKLETSFRAIIADDFDLTIAPFSLSVSPNVNLFLRAKNTAIPFDVFNTIGGELASFDFDGTFDSMVLVSVDDVPAQVYVSASSDDITSLSSLEFELGIDISLEPIKDGEYAYLEIYFATNSIYLSLHLRPHSTLPRNK